MIQKGLKEQKRCNTFEETKETAHVSRRELSTTQTQKNRCCTRAAQYYYLYFTPHSVRNMNSSLHSVENITLSPHL